jgi:hypothetical protein
LGAGSARRVGWKAAKALKGKGGRVTEISSPRGLPPSGRGRTRSSVRVRPFEGVLKNLTGGGVDADFLRSFAFADVEGVAQARAAAFAL